MKTRRPFQISAAAIAAVVLVLLSASAASASYHATAVTGSFSTTVETISKWGQLRRPCC